MTDASLPILQNAVGAELKTESSPSGAELSCGLTVAVGKTFGERIKLKCSCRISQT